VRLILEAAPLLSKDGEVRFSPVFRPFWPNAELELEPLKGNFSERKPNLSERVRTRSMRHVIFGHRAELTRSVRVRFCVQFGSQHI
jgi:hypothetical protein